MSAGRDQTGDGEAACHPNCEEHGKSPVEGIDCQGFDKTTGTYMGGSGRSRSADEEDGVSVVSRLCKKPHPDNEPDSGYPVRCTLPAGHDGDHALTWHNVLPASDHASGRAMDVERPR